MKKYKIVFLMLALITNIFGQIEKSKNVTDFLPSGYVIFGKLNGDLNKDGILDYVLLIKGVDENKIIKDEYTGELKDQNQRGIIVLFNKNDHYELALKNYECFPLSEHEINGVESISFEIKKNNLFINYTLGRAKYSKYNFRYQNSDFELIGYDQIDGGPSFSGKSSFVIDNEKSINFLTNKKKQKTNVNKNAEGGLEVFKETIKKIKIDKLIRLSEIKDFNLIDMDQF